MKFIPKPGIWTIALSMLIQLVNPRLAAAGSALLSDAVAVWQFGDFASDGGTTSDSNGANSLLTLVGGSAVNGPAPRISSGGGDPFFWDMGGAGDGPGADGFTGLIRVDDNTNVDHRRGVYFDAGQGAANELQHTGAHTYMIRTDIKDNSITGYLFNKYDHQQGPNLLRNRGAFLRYEPGGAVRYEVNDEDGTGGGPRFEVLLNNAIPAAQPRLVDFYSVFDPDNDQISVYMLQPKTRAIIAQGTTAIDANFNNIGDSVAGTGMASPVPFTIGDRLTYNSGLAAFESVGFSRADTDIELAAFWDRAFTFDELTNLLPSQTEWVLDNDGGWGFPTNWSSDPALPNGRDEAFRFGSAITAPAEVDINDTRTLGYVEFDSSHAYTLSGSGTLLVSTSAQDGRIDVTSGSHQIDAAVAVQSRLQVTGAGSLTLNGQVDVGGTDLSISAAMKINNTVAGGGVVRSSSRLGADGTTSFDGTSDLVLEGSATLAVDIAGAGPGQFTSFTDVDGADLGNAALEVALSGFAPQQSDTFTVISASSLGGTFNNIADGARLNVLDSSGSFLVNYGNVTNTVVLSDFQGDMPPLTGDFDNSSDVGLEDLNLVLFNWDAPGASLPEEWVNGRPEGNVGPESLNQVLFNWGNMAPKVASVPEPSVVVLLLAVLATTGVRRRVQV